MNVSTMTGVTMNTMQHKEGRVIGTGFMGTVQYRLSNFLYEYYNPIMNDITAIFESRRIDTNTNEETDCLAVVCAQLNPALFHNEEDEDEEMATQPSSASCFQRQRSREYFQEKRMTFTVRLNPDANGKSIESVCQIQDHTGFFPGGYLHVFAMARPAGEPISRIVQTLAEEDLRAIKDGLVGIQKDAQAHGYTIPVDERAYRSPNYEQKGTVPLSLDQHNIWYDRENKQVCLPDRSVYYYYNWPRPVATIEKDLVSSEFWTELVNGSRCASSEDLSPFPKQNLTLCYRTRDMVSDNEWTVVDVDSD